MDYAANYIRSQKDSLTKWDHFINEELVENFQALQYDEKLTPFFGGPDWQAWTPEQRQKLFFNFCQFHSEALVAFEQCIMYIRKGIQKEIPTEEERIAFLHFIREEFMHTKAFRHHLRRELAFNFPKKSLFLHRSHRLKNIFAWILRQEPLAIMIPGAKSETYSLFYTKLLERTFKSASNSYTRLNSLHSEDEVSHVQFDYPFVDSIVKKWSLYRQLRFIFYTFLMIFFIQFIVVFGVSQVFKEALPEMNFFRRLVWIQRCFRWILWSFAPYRQTRTNLKAVYSQRKHFMYYFFRLGSQ